MMSEQIEPIYLMAKDVIQKANQFKNVHILNDLNDDDNIPPQFILPSNKPPICSTIELRPPPLPYRPAKQTTKRSNRRQRTIDQINSLKEHSAELYDTLKELFTLSTELAFRLVILFVIYISMIYNLFRSLAALYLIESGFRSTYHDLSPSGRTIYSIFMLFNLFVDCYGVYTLLKKNIVHIFFYAICLTAFSLLLLIIFGFLSGISVTLSLSIASLCYLFTYVEYKQFQPETSGVCQQCIHHIHHV